MTKDILYLEDDAEARELGKLFLEKEGYDVHTHESPEEGVDCYRGEPVVVTDYLFDGEMTGVDVAEALNGDAEVIMHTGYEQDFVERDAGRQVPENTTFIMKGGGYDEVVEEVETAFDGE